MRAVLLLVPLLAAACVEGAPAPVGAAAGTRIELDGKVLTARQVGNWPVMGWAMEPMTGKAAPLDTGSRADTVILSGAGGDRDLAIRAVGLFCTGKAYDPTAWDTDYVHRDEATGDYWFGYLCS